MSKVSLPFPQPALSGTCGSWSPSSGTTRTSRPRTRRTTTRTPTATNDAALGKQLLNLTKKGGIEALLHLTFCCSIQQEFLVSFSKSRNLIGYEIKINLTSGGSPQMNLVGAACIIASINHPFRTKSCDKMLFSDTMPAQVSPVEIFQSSLGTEHIHGNIQN